MGWLTERYEEDRYIEQMNKAFKEHEYLLAQGGILGQNDRNDRHNEARNERCDRSNEKDGI